MINSNKKEDTQNDTQKNTPEYLSYKNQKHRFSFNQCELLYNEKSFELGLPIEQYIDILGSYNSSSKGYYSEILIWKDLGMYLSVRHKNDDSEPISQGEQVVYGIIFPLEEKNKSNNETNEKEPEWEYPVKKDFILINQMPLKQNTIMKDFVEKEGLKFSDFYSFDRYGYEWQYNDCQKYKNQHLTYSFATKVEFKSKDYGGHLSMRGKPIHGTNQIKRFSVSLSDNEEHNF